MAEANFRTNLAPRSANSLLPRLMPLLCFAAATVWGQNPAAPAVGRVEGADVEVRGQIRLSQEENRMVSTLASGAEVFVRSGRARVLLTDGGEIGVCGPAQFSLVKSEGHLTVALNMGRIEAVLSGAGTLIVYSPQVVATPLAISGGNRDAVVGLDASGGMCAYAARGALRLEQQFAAASVVVPEGGEVAFADAQLAALRDASGTCRCDALSALAKSAHPPPARPANTPAGEASKNVADAPREQQAVPQATMPVWTAIMPPLTFDAKSPTPPGDPSPQIALLIRELRVQPAQILRGHVEAKPIRSNAANVSTTIPPTERASAGKPGGGFGRRFLNFFRRLFGGKPRPAADPEPAGAGL